MKIKSLYTLFYCLQYFFDQFYLVYRIFGVYTPETIRNTPDREYFLGLRGRNARAGQVVRRIINKFNKLRCGVLPIEWNTFVFSRLCMGLVIP